ncbi:hypothetical protein NDU88_007681 [Pleurodeles waltl]|uniref:Uncharacterized protein n=1 Tax=Pleurodeles waltl TaxID=8319 RepID=A0AAV7RT43_PLEWA|nr:hypothetical protein NDU88_007681 [Pleurodeles waltl]
MRPSVGRGQAADHNGCAAVKLLRQLPNNWQERAARTRRHAGKGGGASSPDLRPGKWRRRALGRSSARLREARPPLELRADLGAALGAAQPGGAPEALDDPDTLRQVERGNRGGDETDLVGGGGPSPQPCVQWCGSDESGRRGDGPTSKKRAPATPRGGRVAVADLILGGRLVPSSGPGRLRPDWRRRAAPWKRTDLV